MTHETPGHGLWPVFREAFASAHFTDLTHAFFPGQPRFADFPDEQRSLLQDFSLGHDCQVHHYAHGQWGTHVDPPVHYIQGGRTLDNIPVSQMLLPPCCTGYQRARGAGC